MKKLFKALKKFITIQNVIKVLKIALYACEQFA